MIFDGVLPVYCKVIGVVMCMSNAVDYSGVVVWLSLVGEA